MICYIVIIKLTSQIITERFKDWEYYLSVRSQNSSAVRNMDLVAQSIEWICQLNPRHPQKVLKGPYPHEELFKKEEFQEIDAKGLHLTSCMGDFDIGKVTHSYVSIFGF
ncbi:hypothetical protein N9Y89_01780 [bacterium]|nr:hypothetical protein [bacterium]